MRILILESLLDLKCSPELRNSFNSSERDISVSLSELLKYAKLRQ